MNLAEFSKKAQKAICELKKAKSKGITLVYHDDADGLCSGAITKAALKREGYEVKAFCL